MRPVERLVGSERGKSAGIRQKVQGGCPLPRLSTRLMFRQTYAGGYGSAPGCEAQGSHARTHYKRPMFISGVQAGRHISQWRYFDSPRTPLPI